MVPESPRQGKTASRSWNREASAVCEAPSATILRIIRRWRGPTAIRSHGGGYQAPTELPRRPALPPARYKHEYPQLFTATLTSGTRYSAWQPAAIFLKWRQSWRTDIDIWHWHLNDGIRGLAKVQLNKLRLSHKWTLKSDFYLDSQTSKYPATV